MKFRFPWRSRASIAAAVDTELQFHLDMRTAELEREGHAPADARAIAMREFGDLERARRNLRTEDLGAERGRRMADRLDELRANVAYALRSLRRSPGYATVALLTIAFAVGANTAIFSVVNAVLLAPLPFADPGRLVTVYENNQPNKNPLADMSPADVMDYRAAQRSFTDFGWTSLNGVTILDRNDEPTMLRAAYVSANVLDLVGAKPFLGRNITTGDDAPGAPQVAVLSHATWTRVFGGDSAVVGRKMNVRGSTIEIVGVAAPQFGLGYREQVYVPLDLSRVLADPIRSRKFHFLYGIARLKPGVSAQAAQEDLTGIARQLAAKYPDANAGHLVTVLPTQQAMAAGVDRLALVVFGCAIGVLLVAAANLSNMALARSAARRQEFAIRAAIGAGRGRLVRQLLTESLALSVTGGLLGIPIGVAATKWLLDINPGVLPPLASVSVDWRVVAFTLVAAIIIGLAMGALPALGIFAHDAAAGLGGSRGSVGSARAGVRRALVVAQVALAVILVVGTGLLARSLDAVQHLPLGFEPTHAVFLPLNASGPRYQENAAYTAFYDEIFTRLRATPGVVSVAAASGIPLVGSSGCGLVIEGSTDQRSPDVRCLGVRGDYFGAIGAKLLQGRTFEATDGANAPQVVIINEAAARIIAPDGNPLGKRIRLGPNPAQPWETVIGVFADIRLDDLERAPSPTVLESGVQHTWGSMMLVARSAGDPMLLAPALRAAVKSVDPEVSVRDPQPLTNAIGARLASRRFVLGLVGSFAGLALVVSLIGIYGVLAYLVRGRTREFGVRLALGATAQTLQRDVMREGFGWIAAGLVVGVIGSLVAARAAQSMLYGVGVTDPVTVAGAVALMVVAGAVACFIPARRATRVDPVVALRDE